MLDSRFVARQNRFRIALCFTASVFLSLIGALYSHSQETSSVTLPEIEIHTLAHRILQRAGKADCNPGRCTVLVTNFTFGLGFTSRLGMQIADQLSKELASQQNAIKIIDRFRLQTFLDQERILPTLFNNEKALCWLAKELGANTVLRGTTENRAGPLRVQASLLSCGKNKTGPIEEFSVPDSDSQNALAPSDGFSKTLPASKSSSIPSVPRAGVDGVTSPVCLYCPDPDYTDPAREAKFNGTVLLDVIVSAEGRLIEAKVSHGAPFGLNEEAIKAIRSWQFRPATKDGMAVTVQVPIEVVFHLN